MKNTRSARQGQTANAQYANKPLPPQPIAPPGLTACAGELLGYLQQLEDLQAEIRAKLLGRVPSASGTNAGKSIEAPPLEEVIAHACELAASLVGEQKTILARL